MKNIKYLLLFLLSLGIFNSCLVDDEAEIDLNDQGLNLASFDLSKIDLVALANGNEYAKQIKMLVKGPTIMNVTADITVTVAANATSTAIQGQHYIIDNPTITLTKANNYLGQIEITMLTAGNAPPLDDDPAFADYVAPVLDLDIISATGDSKVSTSGKSARITLNFVPPNPYEGDYSAHLVYWHPTAGGDYPPSPTGTPFVDEVNDKTLSAVTGRKCVTGFATWFETDLCWITVNADNTITFVVDDTWPYDVVLGDPTDGSKVSSFDPATGVIQLYYTYSGTGGNRIFWETFTPKF